ncbi:MAG: prolipoprotein diacylglyceryl transferase, partial [Clostridia bacterium]|nr:prolipoprotein diacylglyceryl transferase [Clostridia bacterium]
MEHWVAFPGLGIEPFSLPRSVVEFSVLGFQFDIRWYGLLITIGLILAVAYAYRQAPRMNINRDHMIDVAMVCFVVAIVCTRLYYVVFYNPQYYFSNPKEILAVWDGGLAIYGGIIGAFASGFIMCRIKKVSVTGMYDLAAIG